MTGFGQTWSDLVRFGQIWSGGQQFLAPPGRRLLHQAVREGLVTEDAVRLPLPPRLPQGGQSKNREGRAPSRGSSSLSCRRQCRNRASVPERVNPPKREDNPAGRQAINMAP
jgi:hypothetical protein